MSCPAAFLFFGGCTQHGASKHSTVVRDVAWHPTQAGVLASGGWDGNVELWTHDPDAVDTQTMHQRFERRLNERYEEKLAELSASGDAPANLLREEEDTTVVGPETLLRLLLAQRSREAAEDSADDASSDGGGDWEPHVEIEEESDDDEEEDDEESEDEEESGE